jgi:hypothetical protein
MALLGFSFLLAVSGCFWLDELLNDLPKSSPNQKSLGTKALDVKSAVNGELSVFLVVEQ